MLAWRLTHRVAIEELVEVQDTETGAITHTWRTLTVGGTSLGAVPAEVLTGPGREQAAAGTKLAETSARVQMHWFPGLTTKHRIVWDGMPMDILAIQTDRTGRREYQINCRYGITDGK